jgi:lipid-A-disaccharide synthase
VASSDKPSLQPALRAGMVAGETSGDLLAGLLLDGLMQRWPQMDSFGIGGPHMAQRGFEAWWPHDKLAVHGLGLDVLLRYREIIGIRKQLKARLLQDRPDVFIGVDAPDFNLDLEADLRQVGIKTVHFVCPSVWAWRAERLEKIRRSVDHVLCLFPFEPALLQQHGIAATYVGHPLAHVIPKQVDQAAARQRLGLDTDRPVVALLPGSRRSEIKYLSAVFLQAAALVRQARADVQWVLPAVPSLQVHIEQAVQEAGLMGVVQVVAGQSHAALAACDVTLIASGTATLEAALFKRPMVIAYRMSTLSWALMRRKRLQPWVGLPNILCQDFVVPELLQDQATPAKLAQAVLGWLDALQGDRTRVQTLEQRFAQLHDTLAQDTTTLAAQAVAQVLEA